MVAKDKNFTARTIIYKTCVLSLNELKYLLTKKDLPIEDRIRSLKRFSLIGALTYDWITRHDYPNGWGSLSALEMFIFIAHRERVLSKFGLSSAQLLDEVGEHAHIDVATDGSNNRDNSRVIKNTLRTLLCTALDFKSCFNKPLRPTENKKRMLQLEPDEDVQELINNILSKGCLLPKYNDTIVNNTSIQ